MAEAAAGTLAGCRLLEWDSTFFGFRIASVDPLRTAGGFAGVDEWCAREGVACAYLLVDPSDRATIAGAQSHGFVLVDVRVTLEGSLDAVAPAVPPPGIDVRSPVERDVPQLRAIARTNHRDTRFYADPRFDRGRCDDMYDVWIDKSCHGWADHVVAAYAGGDPIGYVTCHRGESEGRIGLVGIAASHRGQGAGRAMIAAALRWLGDAGCRRVSVVTQGANAGALRLYQGAGMHVRSLHLWFHRSVASPQ